VAERDVSGAAFTLEIADLRPLVRVLATALTDENNPAEMLGAVGLAGRGDFRTGNMRTRWQAALTAALAADDDKLADLVEWALEQLGTVHARKLRTALDEAARQCVARSVRDAHPELGGHVEAVISDQTVDGVREAAGHLRNAALSLRLMLTDRLLGMRLVFNTSAFSDPARIRAELADLAIDVVTATDYLLATLGPHAGSSQSFSLLEGTGGGSQLNLDDETRDRLLRRQLDARANVARLSQRLFSAIRRDFVM
jgi:hypothetical protein